MKYKLFTDGGARGNPGPAGLGAILFDGNGMLLDFDSKYIGDATNNVAEYQAILLGIQMFRKFALTADGTKPSLECYLDSELIVKQMNGEYKVKDETLRAIHNVVKQQIVDLDTKFIHIRREKNKFADKLVNISLDAADEQP